MRIGVLETGAPPAKLTPRFGNYVRMFQDLLGEGYDFTAYDVQAGAWPDQPEDCDAYLITGSSAGVYEPDPWIATLMDFLRQARGRARLVGVCFGHQAMAQAFGGRVIKSPKGWGVGLHAYQVLQREPWMDPALAEISVPASHQDQVVELPHGARVLAASDFTPFGMLQYADKTAISLQLHPEFVPDFAAALIENERGTRFSDAEADAAVASLRQPNDNSQVGAWIRRFLD